MTDYVVNVGVYTLAMLGIFFIAIIISKKFLNMNITQKGEKNFLSLESRLFLEPRKSLYVIKAGRERFLIATNAEGSQLIAKLESQEINIDKTDEINPESYKDNQIKACDFEQKQQNKLFI